MVKIFFYKKMLKLSGFLGSKNLSLMSIIMEWEPLFKRRLIGLPVLTDTRNPATTISIHKVLFFQIGSDTTYGVKRMLDLSMNFGVLI